VPVGQHGVFGRGIVNLDLGPFLFIENSTFDSATLYDAIKKREYDRLPDVFADVAKEAMTVLLETSDGQLCDIIIDRACMQHVRALGQENRNELIRRCCELFVASADIKLAVRCAKTGKRLDFIRRALAPCDTLDTERLAVAASLGYEDITKYLNDTAYKGATEALGRSMSAFEKWCDDTVLEKAKAAKYVFFGFDPIAAYFFAKTAEIKTVRILLSAKKAGVAPEIIKERVRALYV
jgi:V/A-type H+-transporting ATPase subunit C